MKTIGNISSIAVYAAVATVLAACSANPVEDTNNKKPVVAAKAANNVKAPVKVAAVKKESVSKKKTIAKVATPAKPSRTEALAKKKSIIAMAKVQKAQQAAKVQQARARAQQARIRASKAQAAKVKARQTVSVARAVYKKPVVSKTTSRKPVSNIRSPQPVGVRSPQPVGTRGNAVSKQYAQRRAPQKVAQARPTVRKVVHRAKTVQSRPAVRLASRTQKPVQRTAYRKPAQAAYRKAVYRKPVVNRAAPKRAIPRIDPNNSFGYALSNAAIERTKHRVRYDGRYLKIGYPWGDVPKSIGVCTDVVIRAYRKLGIDLQSEVHKDISKDFYAYPNLTKWGLDKPDPNIDHRRVYNLQAFFKRHKAELPRSRNPRDYKPGDLVTWMVGPTFPHIGVVVNKPSPSDPNRLMIAHNVGAGPVIEDILFRYPMTGHYRYTPEHRKVNPALHFAKTPPPASVLKKRRQQQASYAQLLQASKYLNAAKPATPVVDTQAKSNSKKPARIYLAQLDSVLAAGSSNLNSAAVQALLKK